MKKWIDEKDCRVVMNSEVKYLKAIELLKRWRSIINEKAQIIPEKEHKAFVVETLKQQIEFLTEVEGFNCEYFSKEGCCAPVNTTTDNCITCVLE